MKTLACYQNGNCATVINTDGSREIRWEGNFSPEFPMSLDCKITQFCDMDGVCSFCHEQSNRQGTHGNLKRGIGFFKDLPEGVEIAIGGGNPLAHPQIIYFLEALRNHGLIANLTVNQLHLKSHGVLLKTLLKNGLIHGLGISLRVLNFESAKPFVDLSENIVWHLIAGVDPLSSIPEISKHFPKPKILILGFKHFGNGNTFFQEKSKQVDDCLFDYYLNISKYFQQGSVISFDNLAIKQLHIKRFFSDEGWKTFYQGDDGTLSMYVDLVKQQFCVSSTSIDRFEIEDLNIRDAFSLVKTLSNDLILTK